METDKKYPLHYVKNVLISVPMLVLLLPLCGYLVATGNHLLSATDVFYVIAADCLCIGQYWFLVAQKRQLLNLMSELQVLIDQSKWQFERFASYWLVLIFFFLHFVSLEEGELRLFDKFVQVEKQVYTFTKQMKAFVTFASSICLFLPCIYAGIRFTLGVYSHNDWWLPYKFAWVVFKSNICPLINEIQLNDWLHSANRVPFDSTKFVGYSVCYGIQLIGSASICAVIYTVNSLFFGVCWYIRSLMSDLITIFDQINGLYVGENNDQNSIRNEFKCHQILRKYVQTHIDTIKWVRQNILMEILKLKKIFVIKIVYQQIYRTFRQHYEWHNICNFRYQRFVDMHIDVSNSFSEYCIFALSQSEIIISKYLLLSLCSSFSSLCLFLSRRVWRFSFVFCCWSSISRTCRTCFCKALWRPVRLC